MTALGGSRPVGVGGLSVRPMQLTDARGVDELAVRAFADLSLRFGVPPDGSSAGTRRGIDRVRHLVTTDPGGAYVAERRGTLIGAALAILREGLWGLSLLVVDPGAQSGGVGSRLLRLAVDYGAGARGGVILASEDARALRAYARAGFALHPSAEATGVPRAVAPPATVRAGSLDDLPLAEAVSRSARGASHASDLRIMTESGARMLVVEGRGYAMASGGELRLLAALDQPAAADLLRAHLAGVPAGERAAVSWVTSHQGWALSALLEAGLELRVGGAVFLRGEVGPFAPYLPSGAYL